MTVAVAAGREARRRARFVTEPLELLGHRIERIDLQPLGALLKGLRRLRGAEMLVLVGLGPRMLPAAWTARRAGIPVIARLGGDPVRDLESRLAAGRMGWRARLAARVTLRARRWLLARADGLIVVNGALIAPLGARTGRDVPIAVAPQFCPGPAEPRTYGAGDPVELLTVANLAFPAKAEGVLWLIDRLAGMAQAGGPRLRLRIAGGGAHLADVRQGLAARTLPDGLRIDVLGHVGDVEALYRTADIFLYRSDHDATPNVLLEAKRFGLPLIANACPEFESLVDDGATGLLHADGADFDEKLARLIADRDLRERLGTAAQDDHRTRFTPGAAGRLLEAALAAHRRAR